MRTIIIGDKPLSKITSIDLAELIEVLGYGYNLEKYHKVRVISKDFTDFDNIVAVGYEASQLNLRKNTPTRVFFFDFKNLEFGLRYSTTDKRVPDMQALPFKGINYLLVQGYNLPLGIRADKLDDFQPVIVDHMSLVKENTKQLSESTISEHLATLKALIVENNALIKRFRP